MRAWIVVVLVVVLGGCKRQDSAGSSKVLVQGGSSEAAFAAQLAAALPGRSLTFDADKHQLAGSNEVISTTNLYQEWLHTDPAGRPEAIRHIAAGFAQSESQTPKVLAEVRGKLRPAVRAVTYFDPAQLDKLGSAAGSAAQTTTIPYVRLGDATAAAIAVDGEDTMTIATNKDLEDWHLTVDQAFAIATANLHDLGATFEQVEPGVWAAQTHDSYDATRITLADDIRKLGLPGGAVALIPNRETLLLAGRKDARALLAMAKRADAVENDPRPIHTVPLCLEDAGWHDCIPDASPAVLHQYQELSARAWVALYTDQHDPYQKQLGDDTFLAHLTALENKATGKIATYATWTRTVPTVLPKADLIAFVVLEGQPGAEKGHMLGLAPWDRVMALVGSHVKETGHMLRYWMTGDYFPTDGELKQLALTQKP